MLLAYLMGRIYRTVMFVAYRTCFYSACDWVQLLAQIGCGPLIVNTVGRVMGANWALRRIWRIAPGWFPAKNEISDIRLL